MAVPAITRTAPAITTTIPVSTTTKTVIHIATVIVLIATKTKIVTIKIAMADMIIAAQKVHQMMTTKLLTHRRFNMGFGEVVSGISLTGGVYGSPPTWAKLLPRGPLGTKD